MPETSDKFFCDICCLEQEYVCMGQCDHLICLECSLRMRTLVESKECTVCRQSAEVVVATRMKHLKPFAVFIEEGRLIEDEPFLCIKHGYRFTAEHVLQQAWEITALYCPLDKCSKRAAFRTFPDLDRHVRRDHNLYYCDICLHHLKLFPLERKCYDRKGLAEHRRIGDVDDKGHRGHPQCEFCNERYLDRDMLFFHLRRDHFFCHICDVDGHTAVFYDQYADLREHFAEEHYICEEGDCREERFTNVFRTELDWKAHRTSTHSKDMDRDQRRQERRVDIDIAYGPSKAQQMRDRRKANRGAQGWTGESRREAGGGDGARFFGGRRRGYQYDRSHNPQSKRPQPQREDEDALQQQEAENNHIIVRKQTTPSPPPPQTAAEEFTVQDAEQEFPHLNPTRHKPSKLPPGKRFMATAVSAGHGLRTKSGSLDENEFPTLGPSKSGDSGFDPRGSTSTRGRIGSRSRPESPDLGANRALDLASARKFAQRDHFGAKKSTNKPSAGISMTDQGEFPSLPGLEAPIRDLGRTMPKSEKTLSELAKKLQVEDASLQESSKQPSEKAAQHPPQISPQAPEVKPVPRAEVEHKSFTEILGVSTAKAKPTGTGMWMEKSKQRPDSGKLHKEDFPAFDHVNKPAPNPKGPLGSVWQKPTAPKKANQPAGRSKVNPMPTEIEFPDFETVRKPKAKMRQPRRNEDKKGSPENVPDSWDASKNSTSSEAPAKDLTEKAPPKSSKKESGEDFPALPQTSEPSTSEVDKPSWKSDSKANIAQKPSKKDQNVKAVEKSVPKSDDFPSLPVSRRSEGAKTVEKDYSRFSDIKTIEEVMAAENDQKENLDAGKSKSNKHAGKSQHHSNPKWKDREQQLDPRNEKDFPDLLQAKICGGFAKRHANDKSRDVNDSKNGNSTSGRSRDEVERKSSPDSTDSYDNSEVGRMEENVVVKDLKDIASIFGPPIGKSEKKTAEKKPDVAAKSDNRQNNPDMSKNLTDLATSSDKAEKFSQSSARQRPGINSGGRNRNQRAHKPDDSSVDNYRSKNAKRDNVDGERASFQSHPGGNKRFSQQRRQKEDEKSENLHEKRRDINDAMRLIRKISNEPQENFKDAKSVEQDEVKLFLETRDSKKNPSPIHPAFDRNPSSRKAPHGNGNAVSHEQSAISREEDHFAQLAYANSTFAPPGLASTRFPLANGHHYPLLNHNHPSQGIELPPPGLGGPGVPVEPVGNCPPGLSLQGSYGGSSSHMPSDVPPPGILPIPGSSYAGGGVGSSGSIPKRSSPIHMQHQPHGNAYMKPTSYNKRQALLHERIEHRLSAEDLYEFKLATGQFKRDQLNAKDFYKEVQTLFSKSDDDADADATFAQIYPELVAYIPSIEKQHSLRDADCGRTCGQLKSCRICYQLLLPTDLAEHKTAHSGSG